MPVNGDLEGDATGEAWMGWSWSPWVPAARGAGASGVGLYRLRSRGAPDLLYVGQGLIASRLMAHGAKSSVPAHRQAAFFAAETEASWTLLEVPTVHLLEHENDLIASHVLTMVKPPAAQFLG